MSYENAQISWFLQDGHVFKNGFRDKTNEKFVNIKSTKEEEKEAKDITNRRKPASWIGWNEMKEKKNLKIERKKLARIRTLGHHS